MMNKTALLPFSALALASALTVASAPAAACGTEAYIGQVCLTAASYCPMNTMELNGQTMTVGSNVALYSLTSCLYGGDCRNTFNLPNLRGRFPVQYGQGPGLTLRPFGQYFGQETVTQTINTMAQHNHIATVSSSGGAPKLSARQADATSNVPQNGSVLGQSLAGLDAANIYLNPAVTPGTDVALGGVSGGGSIASVAIGIAGSGTPIPIVPPQLAMRYCIVTEGLYPPRP